MPKNIEPMDILMAPTHEDIILAKISKWFNKSCLNKDQTITVTFKKNTPASILKLFIQNTSLLPKVLGYKVSKKYRIEK